MVAEMKDLKSTDIGSVRLRVYEYLRQSIIEMKIKPGQRLVERDLIAMTGASRTSVREALRELISDGIVETLPYNRHVVAIPSVKEVSELYEIRGRLEALSAQRFAANASDHEIAQLRQLFDEYVASQELSDRLRVKGEFYRTLGEHSKMAHSVIDGLNARVALMRTLSLSAPGRHEDSVEELRHIVSAIEKRDPSAAEAAAALHAGKARKVVLELMTQSPWSRAVGWE